MSKVVKRKFEMRCCVPLCKNDSDNIDESSDISFHMFPESEDIRKLWLDSLELHEWFQDEENDIDCAVVCSEHFASADLYCTKSGFKKLRVGAVPLIIQETLEEEAEEVSEEDEHDLLQVQICRICLEYDCELFPMSQHRLGEIYQNMTGFAMCEDERASQTFCTECAQRLLNFDKFREKSLKADFLIAGLLNKTNKCIAEEILKIDRKELGLKSNLTKQTINHEQFDLFIQEDQSDQETKEEMDELTVLNTNKNSVVERVHKKTHATPEKNITISRDSKKAMFTNANRSLEKNNDSRNISIQMAKPNYQQDIIVKEEIKQEKFDTDTSQLPQVDYIPVIDVVIDNKFKIIRKDELLKKNTQIVIANKTPVKQIDKSKPVIRNQNTNTPAAVKTTIKQCQTNFIMTPNKQNVKVNKEIQAAKKEQKVLPVIIGDRIVMPNVEGDNPSGKSETMHVKRSNRNQSVTNDNRNRKSNINKKDTPILENMLTNIQNRTPKSFVSRKESPKSSPIKQYVRKNVVKTSIVQKDMPKVDDEHEELKTVENEEEEEGKAEGHDKEYEVLIEHYGDQEFYEESVVEAVDEDYLDVQSEEDCEMTNIKREVESIMEERDITLGTDYLDKQSEKDCEMTNIKHEVESIMEERDITLGASNKSYNENMNETNDNFNEDTENDNDGNNDTWDDNYEEANDDFTWEQDDYDEDHNSEDNETESAVENPEQFRINQTTDSEATKRAKINRKRRSVLKNYGKTYFSDDLNDVIFNIKQLTLEEQLVEIRNRLTTTYKGAAYHCNLCFRGFMHDYAYNRHMTLHDEAEGEFECLVCRFKFPSAKVLENHQAARHATKFSCTLCDFSTCSAEPARQHGMKHRGIKYQCPYCTEECVRYTVLMDHIAIAHTPESLCPVCGLKLASDEELERHRSVRHKDEVQWEEGVQCKKCDMVFADDVAYRLHLGVSIKHDSEFITEHIKAKRNQEAEFLTAVSKIKPEVIGPLTCEQCGMELPSLRKYHAHFRRDHPDKTRTFYPTMKTKVMCELCGKFLKANWQYMEHMRLHTNVRPYACDVCGKAFINSRLLGMHRYVHDARRPRPDIRCKLCGKNFANKGNLHRHMGDAHSDALRQTKKYTRHKIDECDICGKILANRSNLNRHKSVHTDEKRFKCEICNTSYRQKAEMKSHYDHVHLRKPWPKRHRPNKRDGSMRRSTAPTSEDDNSQTVIEEVVEEMEVDY